MAKRGVNQVILIGNLGSDPDTRFMQDGSAVTNISIATSESWKDKNTGEEKKVVEWHRVCFFKQLADIAAQYLKKGAKVYVTGKLRTRKWQDNNGQDRYTTEIVAHEMQMLDSRVDNVSDAALPPHMQQPHTAPKPQTDPQPQPQPDQTDFDEDGIPF